MNIQDPISELENLGYHLYLDGGQLRYKCHAMQAKDSKMLAWATEIKIRAERKAGEMLKGMEKNTGAKGQLKGKNSSGSAKKLPPENNAPTLSRHRHQQEAIIQLAEDSGDTRGRV